MMLVFLSDAPEGFRPHRSAVPVVSREGNLSAALWKLPQIDLRNLESTIAKCTGFGTFMAIGAQSVQQVRKHSVFSESARKRRIDRSGHIPIRESHNGPLTMIGGRAQEYPE